MGAELRERCGLGGWLSAADARAPGGHGAAASRLLGAAAGADGNEGVVGVDGGQVGHQVCGKQGVRAGSGSGVGMQGLTAACVRFVHTGSAASTCPARAVLQRASVRGSSSPDLSVRVRSQSHARLVMARNSTSWLIAYSLPAAGETGEGEGEGQGERDAPVLAQGAGGRTAGLQ